MRVSKPNTCELDTIVLPNGCVLILFQCLKHIFEHTVSPNNNINNSIT